MKKNIDKACVKCLQEYFSDGANSLAYHGDTSIVEEIVDIWCKGDCDFPNCPDMYFKLDEKVLIIEHFEFDCYNSFKKGSKGKIEIARIDRRFKQAQIDGIPHIHDVIKGETSYEYYIGNVIKNFEHHYKRIDAYIEELKRDGVITSNTKMQVAFLIENTSPLGCVYVDEEDTIRPCSLMECREFLCYLKSKMRVDYVIGVSNDWNQKNRCIIVNKNIDKYLEHSVDYSDKELLLSNPQVAGGFIQLEQE